MSDIKHTASLEVIIYGQGNIDQITNALKKANVQFENLVDDAEAAQRATEKFGQTQTRTSKLVVRNANDAAKAIKEINEAQQKSIEGASKAVAAQRKRRFADMSLRTPEGAGLASTSKAQATFKRVLESGGLKSGKDLEESFRVLQSQSVQAAKAQLDRANKEKERIAKEKNAADAKQARAEEKRINQELARVKKETQVKEKEQKKAAEYADSLMATTRIVGKSGNMAAASQKSNWAKYQKETEKILNTNTNTLGETQEQIEKLVSELNRQTAILKSRARKGRASRGRSLVGFAQPELASPSEAAAIQRENDQLRAIRRAENRRRQNEQYRQSEAENQQFLRAASERQRIRDAADRSELAQQRAERSRRRAEDNAWRAEQRRIERRDRERERYTTSWVPQQLQPFFRRGGLFMQGQYQGRQAPSGPFGGIRGALGGGGGGFSGEGYGGPSGPMRVIAYDALRRVLTEVYTMVSRIAGTFKDWIIEGVKFNDELVRAQTFFTSLGLLGMKGAAGGDITVAEASVSSNVKIKQAYEKSSVAAEEMMNRMMAVSALTGQDLGEIVSSARQSMTDLLNKVNKTSGGKSSAFLENPKMFGDVAERMVKLASVLRMADPQNRKLGFHMVGLQELFSGSTGGKKDSGLQNVLSLLRREGIKIEKGVATEITKLVNKGDITGAMDKVEEALSRAGLGMVQLQNMLNSTLQPAIDGAIMYAKIFNRIFTKALYENSLKPFFRSLLKTSDLIFRNKDKMAVLETIGQRFATALDPIFLRLTQLLDFVQGGYSDPTAMTYVNNTIATVAGIMDVMLAFSEIVVAFVAGLMGQADSRGLEELSKWVRSWTGWMLWLGGTIRSTIEFVQRFDAAIGNIIKNSALVILAVTAIVGVFSAIAIIILGIVAPFLGLVWAMRELAIVLPIVRGLIVGLIEGVAAMRAARAVSSVAPNINLLPSGAAARTAQTAQRAGFLSRAGALARGLLPVAGGLVASIGGGIASGAAMTAIAPLIPWILGAVAIVAAGYFAYNALNNRETNAQAPTASKEARMATIAPVPPPVKKVTVTNNPTINVTVTGVTGSPQQVGQSVGNSVLDSFRSVFRPIPEV